MDHTRGEYRSTSSFHAPWSPSPARATRAMTDGSSRMARPFQGRRDPAPGGCSLAHLYLALPRPINAEEARRRLIHRGRPCLHAPGPPMPNGSRRPMHFLPQWCWKAGAGNAARRLDEEEWVAGREGDDLEPRADEPDVVVELAGRGGRDRDVVPQDPQDLRDNSGGRAGPDEVRPARLPVRRLELLAERAPRGHQPAGGRSRAVVFGGGG